MKVQIISNMFFSSLVLYLLIFIPTSKCSKDYNSAELFFGNMDSIFDGKLLSFWAKNNSNNNYRMTKDDARCLKDIELWANGFEKYELWAMEMYDAFGKKPYGLLTGNVNSFGQRQQCIDIRHTVESDQSHIRGKYCLAKIPLPPIIMAKMRERLYGKPPASNNEVLYGEVPRRPTNRYNETFVFNLGICIPHSCSAKFAEKRLQELLTENLIVPEHLCDMGEPQEWETVEIVVLSIFAFFGAIVCLSTSYDVWFLLLRKETDSKDKKELMRSFSLYSNGQKVLKFGSDPGPLGCLHGIRALSILWIVLGHRYDLRQISPMENYLDINKWSTTANSMPIISAIVGVDSFFVMSGILLSYVFFRMKSADGFLKILPMFYIHRYLRLTPVVGIVILFYAGLSGRLFYGPLKEYLTLTMQDYCRINWWTNLLYVQNYVDTERICVSQTWYLSIDMQLYVISPLILYPLLRKPKVGLTLLTLWILVSQAITFYIAYDGGWWGGMLTLDPNRESWRAKFYVPAYTRATPWLLGVMLGYVLKKSLDKKKLKGPEDPLTSKQKIIRRVINVVGWILALAVMAASIFGMVPLQAFDHEFSYLEDTTFLAFSKTAWTFGLMWVICSCFYGYGGPINWFLCLTPFQFIGRISYTLYLVHKLVQVTHLSLISHVSSFTHFTIIYEFFGDMTACIALAFVVSLCFESPIMILEKKMFRTDRPKPKPKVEAVQEPTVLDTQQAGVMATKV